MFHADEIQSGYGRTGKMYAMEHYDIAPDLITTAKSLAGGMPLAAVVGRAEIMDATHGGGIGGTYSGNPVSCAAAMKVAEVYKKENVVAQAAKLGERARKDLEALKAKYPIIGDVRGLGPMLSAELVKDQKTKEPAGEECDAIVKAAWQNGLVLLSCGSFHNCLRFLMPVTISDAEYTKGMKILEDAFAAVCKK